MEHSLDKLIAHNVSLLKAAGVSDLYKKTESTSPTEYLALLASVEASIGNTPYRYVPSSFGGDEKTLGIPRSLEWKWTTLERTLRLWQSRMVLNFMPPFWQVESSLQRACRAVGAPFFSVQPNNLPLASVAAIELQVDTAVVEAKEAEAAAAYFMQKKCPLPKHWLLVHAAQGVRIVPSSFSAQSVAHEVHLFPGICILTQCVLAEKGATLKFHLSPSYIQELSEEKTLITSAGDDPLPFIRYELPFALIPQGNCPCGAEAFSIK